MSDSDNIIYPEQFSKKKFTKPDKLPDLDAFGYTWWTAVKDLDLPRFSEISEAEASLQNLIIKRLSPSSWERREQQEEDILYLRRLRDVSKEYKFDKADLHGVYGSRKGELIAKFRDTATQREMFRGAGVAAGALVIATNQLWLNQIGFQLNRDAFPVDIMEIVLGAMGLIAGSNAIQDYNSRRKFKNGIKKEVTEYRKTRKMGGFCSVNLSN